MTLASKIIMSQKQDGRRSGFCSPDRCRLKSVKNSLSRKCYGDGWSLLPFNCFSYKHSKASFMNVQFIHLFIPERSITFLWAFNSLWVWCFFMINGIPVFLSSKLFAMLLAAEKVQARKETSLIWVHFQHNCKHVCADFVVCFCFVVFLVGWCFFFNHNCISFMFSFEHIIIYNYFLKIKLNLI